LSKNCQKLVKKVVKKAVKKIVKNSETSEMGRRRRRRRRIRRRRRRRRFAVPRPGTTLSHLVKTKKNKKNISFGSANVTS
jgi:hypothetical protein